MKAAKDVEDEENIEELIDENKSEPQKEASEVNNIELERPKLCCSARLIFTILCFFAIFNVCYIRVGVSMAIVCMVKTQKPKDVDDFYSKEEEFEWSSALKGILFSAVFYGFIIGPFLAGFLSFKFGGKVVMVIANILPGAAYLFIPEGTRFSPILFFFFRFISGLFSSFTIPAFYDLVSHWIVPEETQLLVTGMLVGIPLGNIFNNPVGAYICKWFGWVWIFYIPAIWFMAWGIVFSFMIFNYPGECFFISDKERFYLQKRIPKQTRDRIPWKNIIKSLPVHAYIVMHFCANYVYITTIFSFPQFMKDVHNFSLESSGLLLATPYIGSLTMRILLSLFLERLRLKLRLSKNALRKINVFLGAFFVSVFFFIGTLFSYAYPYLNLFCFIIVVSSLELNMVGGYLLSLLDLCPSYVNIVSGIANTISNVAGLISPIVIGLITFEGTIEEWNRVYYVNIPIIVVSTTFYLVFGQNQLQYWGLATNPSEIPPSGTSI